MVKMNKQTNQQKKPVMKRLESLILYEEKTADTKKP